jgi:uncharacterized membrane protein YhaH (DUF805 family)
VFEAPFSFQGRIGRPEYIITSVMQFAFNFACLQIMDADLSIPLALLTLACVLVFAWFYLAQGAKRCHDMGISGWWQLIPFFSFYMMIKAGVGEEGEAK